jgi:hypothetical protein
MMPCFSFRQLQNIIPKYNSFTGYLRLEKFDNVELRNTNEIKAIIKTGIDYELNLKVLDR